MLQTRKETSSSGSRLTIWTAGAYSQAAWLGLLELTFILIDFNLGRIFCGSIAQEFLIPFCLFVGILLFGLAAGAARWLILWNIFSNRNAWTILYQAGIILTLLQAVFIPLALWLEPELWQTHLGVFVLAVFAGSLFGVMTGLPLTRLCLRSRTTSL